MRCVSEARILDGKSQNNLLRSVFLDDGESVIGGLHVLISNWYTLTRTVRRCLVGRIDPVSPDGLRGQAPGITLNQ